MSVIRKAKEGPISPESLETPSVDSMISRTSLLNTKYFGHKLRRTNNLYMISEFLIIFGSAASGVSGWAIWTFGLTKQAWLVIAAISTLMSAIKPILQLNKKIERYSRLFTGHNSNFLSMDDLVKRVAICQGISPELEREYKQLYHRYIQLSNEDDPSPQKSVVVNLMAEVEKQNSAGKFMVAEMQKALYRFDFVLYPSHLTCSGVAHDRA